MQIRVPLLLFWMLISLHAVAEKVGPWDLDALKKTVPPMKWLREDQPVRSLLYAGEVFQGKPTEVFAFYASPVTLGEAKPGGKFPGVVLIHGGGGTAFADWVYLWAKRGYAAIAMDLSGSRPPDPEFDEKGGARGNGHRADSRVRLENGGPNHGHPEKFDSIGGEVSDDWPFHAVSSVMRAHTLLRSFSEVDAQNTAVTGISWGGYTTCLVASLDDRFKAAVPVYGCGFLHEGESVQKPSIDKLGERAVDWVREYDPSSHLGRCRVPVLFVNGTNDVHYVLDSYMKSYRLVPGEKRIRVEVKMAHGHQAGWAPGEIGRFIDSKCRGGEALAVVGKPVVEGGRVVVQCASGVPLEKAELHYTVDGGPRAKREWQTVAASVEGLRVVAPVPPAEANTWYVSVRDARGAMVSSEVEIRAQ
jgi:dienelactone hydrolase